MRDSERRGAILVSGPAGTGKTTWLRRRHAALIEAGETGILFLVSDRRAARGLSDQILRDVGRSTGEVRVATWHSFALSLLRMYWPSLGYDREPGLLTGPEQFALVKEMIDAEVEREHWTGFERQLGLNGFATELRTFVMRAQDNLEDPAKLEERARLARRPELEEAARFFRRYLTMLDDKAMVDASNAIALCVTLLTQHPEVAAEIREGARHLLVDDYQDITVAQEALLRALFSDGGSIAVAADPDARVYGFRGAMPNAVERFRDAFPPVTEVALTEVHRGQPEREAWLFEHLTQEADAIAREARRLRTREGIGWGDIAVIVRRYGGGSRAIRHAFERADVPYVIVGENRPLIHEPVLRPMLDLARAALDTAEVEDLLPGLLSSPIVGLDPYEVRALHREARVRDTSLTTLMTAPPTELPERLRAGLLALRDLIDQIRDRDASGANADELFWFMWEHLDHFRDLVARGEDADLDAIAAFARAVDRFSERRRAEATFRAFLDAIGGAEFGPEPWRMPEERRPDAVRILTAHNAIGTEFDAVFIAGCVEGEFPDTRAPRAMLDLRDLLEPKTVQERRAERVAEERRLFGVAAGRARRRVVITAATESNQHDALTPSAFVEAAGLTWGAPPDGIDALTRAEAEAQARKVLAAPGSEPALRAEALDLLARLPGVEPDDWWYAQDWTDPGTPIIGEELLTSYSRLSVYENCGLQYLYQVEMGLDPASSHAMLVGTWVHDIVDRAARGEIEMTEAALWAELERVWDPTIFEGKAIEDRRKRDCRDMLSVWLKVDAELHTLATEVAFKFPVDGALVRGRIDSLVRFGGSMVRVIDYKTARWAKSEAELKEDLQLAIYNLAMLRDPELAKLGKPKHLELAYLGTVWRGGFKRPGIDPSKIEDYEARTDAAINRMVAGIRAEDFSPNPDADCKWCSFRTLCPIWPQGDEVAL